MAIWISKFLGPIILALSVPMMLTPARIEETARRFIADSPLILISGVLAMVAGLAIVNTHNIWILDWPVIITVFGWALVIGGAIRIIAPEAVERIGGAMLDHPTMTRALGAVWVSLGAFLTFHGYL